MRTRAKTTLHYTSLILSVLLFTWSGTARAVTAADIADEAFFTYFNDLAPGAGGQGLPYAPTSAQNPIGTLASFGAPGIVSFLNSPPYYIFPTSPVSLGFAGAATMDITFSTPLASVSLGVRGTRTGTSTGPGAAGNPFPASTPLIDAVGTVTVLDAYGAPVVSTTTAIDNADMALVAEIVFTAAGVPGGIHGLRFEQTVADPAAGLMVGGLGITPIPEPGTALLLLLGLGGLAQARRDGVA